MTFHNDLVKAQIKTLTQGVRLNQLPVIVGDNDNPKSKISDTSKLSSVTPKKHGVLKRVYLAIKSHLLFM